MAPQDEASPRPTGPITLIGVWGDLRALRHDVRNLEANAKLALEGVPVLAEKLKAMRADIDRVATTQADFHPDQMSPRERAVLPAMARSWIDGVEQAEQQQHAQRESERRVTRLVAYATIAQVLVAIVAVLVTYFITRH